MVSRYQFDPKRFYEAGVAWGVAGEPEAHLRSAVSRAYYACFHLARLGLERGGKWSAGSANAHSAVLLELRRRGRREVAIRLRILKGLREQADYDLDTPMDDETCRQALDRAAVLIRILDRF